MYFDQFTPTLPLKSFCIYPTTPSQFHILYFIFYFLITYWAQICVVHIHTSVRPPTGSGQPTNDHTTEENWLWPPLADHSSLARAACPCWNIVWLNLIWVLLSSKDTVSSWSSLNSGSHNLSALYFVMLPEAWGKGSWYSCPIYSWEVHRHSVLWLVNFYVECCPLYSEASLIKKAALVCLSTCPSICLYTYLPVYLSTWQFNTMLN